MPSRALAALGILSLVSWCALAAISRQTAYPPLLWFFLAISIATLSWIAAWRLSLKTASKPALRIVVAFSLLFRIAGLVGVPLYEDDYFRYLWDGFVSCETGRLFAKPSEFFGADNLPPKAESVLGHLNNPDIPTIYGPVPQASFALAYLIAPFELWPLKLIYILADLGIAWMVWKASRSISAVVLYAWCPLVIKEVALSAHTDILASFFVLLSVLLAQRPVLSGAGFGLAIASKVSSAALGPAVLVEVLRDRSTPRLGTLLRFGGFAGLVWIATYLLQYSLLGFGGHWGIDLKGLQAFMDHWEFNSFGFALWKLAAGDHARVGSSLSYVAFVMVAALWKREWLRADVLLAVLFLFSPVVNPWYLVILAPFVALRPSGWGIAALSGVFVSYATLGNLGVTAGSFDHPLWVRPLELAIVAIGLMWDGRTKQEAEPFERQGAGI
jgi:alpha-1,6-mannosyltransferase